MSEPTVIDTALANAAGTVVKELEPEAITAFDDLKAFVHTQADRLRTALPALEQAATDHIRGVVGAVLGEYENVLGRIDAHLAPPTPATPIEPSAPVTADPTTPAPATPADASSLQSNATSAPSEPAAEPTQGA